MGSSQIIRGRRSPPFFCPFSPSDLGYQLKPGQWGAERPTVPLILSRLKREPLTSKRGSSKRGFIAIVHPLLQDIFEI